MKIYFERVKISLAQLKCYKKTKKSRADVVNSKSYNCNSTTQ